MLSPNVHYVRMNGWWIQVLVRSLNKIILEMLNSDTFFKDGIKLAVVEFLRRK